MPQKIILDVDTGIDDALAIYYALRRPELEVVALTNVFGNTNVEIAAANSLRILELAGRPDIPVAVGAGRSLLWPYVRLADHVHGSNGLGDVVLPEPEAKPVSEHAVDLIIRMVKEAPGEIILCPVGPLTNIGLALARAPEIAGLVKEIVVMGSNLYHPGITGIPQPMIDPNFRNDPEAAHIMLQSGAKLTLVGMDVTMTTLMSRQMMEDIRQNGQEAGRVLMDISEFYVRAYEEMHPGIGGCGLHDPLAVAACHQRDIITREHMRVDIELYGEYSRGRCIPDRREINRDRFNCDVATVVDRPRFERMFHETMLL